MAHQKFVLANASNLWEKRIMKIAEALTKGKDLKGKIAALQKTLSSKLTVTKFSEEQVIPEHDPLIADIVSLTEELAELKSRIVKTNVANGLIPTIHELQEAKFMVGLLDDLDGIEQETVSLQTAGIGNAPMKVKTLATFNVANAKALHQTFQTKLRSMDLELQKRNWEIDLID